MGQSDTKNSNQLGSDGKMTAVNGCIALKKMLFVVFVEVASFLIKNHMINVQNMIFGRSN